MIRILFTGGVFIATLFGLVLALITLAGEVLYYRKKQKTFKVNSEMCNNQLNKFSLMTIPNQATTKSNKAVSEKTKFDIRSRNKNKITFIK